MTATAASSYFVQSLTALSPSYCRILNFFPFTMRICADCRPGREIVAPEMAFNDANLDWFNGITHELDENPLYRVFIKKYFRGEGFSGNIINLATSKFESLLHFVGHK